VSCEYLPLTLEYSKYLRNRTIKSRPNMKKINLRLKVKT